MLNVLRINTFAIPVALYVVRNGYAYYQSMRATYNSRKHTICNPPTYVTRTLNILFVVAVVALLSTLPYFSPSNIFYQTNTRLQTSIDVIFARLSALRPLSPLDYILKSKLTTKDGRLLYFTFGPSVLTSCSFCTLSDPNTYLFYALPSILTPHLFHISVLGIVTSSMFAGSEGARWRTPATLIGVCLAAVELYMTATYNVSGNTRATRSSDIDFFYWRMRLMRGLAIAGVDGLLGLVLWLAATNRFFLRTMTTRDRLNATMGVIEQTNFRLWANANLRNTVVRDETLLGGAARYWQDEKEVYEQREVINALNVAMSSVDMRQLTEAAEKRADDILGLMQVPS